MNVYKKGDWQYWYDRSTRCWWFAKYDNEGNQVGPAYDTYHKSDVIKLIERADEFQKSEGEA